MFRHWKMNLTYCAKEKLGSHLSQKSFVDGQLKKWLAWAVLIEMEVWKQTETLWRRHLTSVDDLQLVAAVVIVVAAVVVAADDDDVAAAAVVAAVVAAVAAAAAAAAVAVAADDNFDW